MRRANMPAARELRVRCIEGRDLAMELARTFKRLGMLEGVRSSVRHARAAQHQALGICRSVMP